MTSSSRIARFAPEAVTRQTAAWPGELIATVVAHIVPIDRMKSGNWQ